MQLKSKFSLTALEAFPMAKSTSERPSAQSQWPHHIWVIVKSSQIKIVEIGHLVLLRRLTYT
jgi:hypothetical protein